MCLLRIRIVLNRTHLCMAPESCGVNPSVEESLSYSSASTTLRSENNTIVRQPIFSSFSIGGVVGAPNGLEVHKFCHNSRTKHYKTAKFQIKKTRFYSRINIYFHLISTGRTDIAGTDRQTHKVTTVCSLRACAPRHNKQLYIGRYINRRQTMQVSMATYNS